jgi:uncharacterized membrane protein YeaQ/YmgE (transglycosylase-associated protein family)
MLNILFWIAIGALSGWIGYLATRTNEPGPIKIYLAVGSIGGLIGGLSAQALGFAESTASIDPTSILNALIASALLIVLFVAFLNFFGNASSS